MYIRILANIEINYFIVDIIRFIYHKLRLKLINVG